MTGFELSYLYATIASAIAQHFSNFFTVVSAYLIVAHLAAHRLTIPMVVIVNGVFLLWSAQQISQITGAMTTWVGLAGDIRSYTAQGNGLAWHAVNQTSLSTLQGIPMFNLVLLTIVVIAAVYFFFHSRRHHMPPTPPK